jgi:hypothetical protein
LLAREAFLAGTVYLSSTKGIYTTKEMKALVLNPARSLRPDTLSPFFLLLTARENAKRE